MVLKPEISIGDILTLLGLLVASLGLFLTWLSMRQGNRQKRAEFLINLYNLYASDTDMLSVYYEIEYDEFTYDESFHQSDKERSLDKLLGLFEHVAKLWMMGNLTLRDVEIVAYEYLVVYQNEAVQEYLNYLDHWFEERGMRVKPYAAFRRLGAALQKRFYSERKKRFFGYGG